MNFRFQNAKSGCEPIVSVDLAEMGHGTTRVSVWMSEWTSGGLNGGKGTPFWVWGGVRALNKVREIAKLVDEPAVSSPTRQGAV
jgi:hypothetical protein